MKKFFVCALICALCSCTSESFIDIENIEVPEVQEVKKAKFDKSEEFFAICIGIIDVHKEFERFREVLPKKLLKKMDKGNYNLREAVEIIETWLSDYDCYDILIEWPEVDDYLAMRGNF